MNCWYCEFFYKKKEEEPCCKCVNKDKFELWKTKGEGNGEE